MEKVSCCLQEALDREANIADKLQQLEDHMLTKRFLQSPFETISCTKSLLL